MTLKDKEVFAESELFSSFDINEYKNEIEIISAKKGERVMGKDSFRRCLVLIISGEAVVSKKGLDGKATIMNTFHKGDVFGMATLFYEEAEFPSEITAGTNLKIAVLGKETVEKVIFENPGFARAYITLLSQKIHFLNKKLSAFSESEAHEKLLRWIMSTADGKEEFILPCSLTKLSSMLGIGRASVYRSFESLEKQGKIKKDGKKIVILKP